MVKQAAAESEAQVQKIKEDSSVEQEKEQIRAEESLTSERAKNEEQLAAAKHSEQKEMMRLKREGDQALEKLKATYGDMFYKLERDAEKRKLRFQNEEVAQTDLHNQDLKQAEETMRKTKSMRIDQMDQSHKDVVSSITAQNNFFENQLRTQSELARVQSMDKFLEERETILNNYNTALKTLNERTTADVENLRSGYTEKLTAYSTQKSDPFYRLKEFDAAIDDTDSAYIVVARVPKHEQDHIQVSVHGDEVVISGARRSEETLKNEDGSLQSSHSYETYSRSFPLKQAVQKDFLTRQFDGDHLIVTLPKKGELTHFDLPQKNKIEPVRADRPKFPRTLPGTSKT